MKESPHYNPKIKKTQAHKKDLPFQKIMPIVDMSSDISDESHHFAWTMSCYLLGLSELFRLMTRQF